MLGFGEVVILERAPELGGANRAGSGTAALERAGPETCHSFRRNRSAAFDPSRPLGPRLSHPVGCHSGDERRECYYNRHLPVITYTGRVIRRPSSRLARRAAATRVG